MNVQDGTIARDNAAMGLPPLCHRPTRTRSEQDALETGPDSAITSELRLGLSSGALYPTATEDVPAIAARHGFHDLELMLQTPGEYQSGFVTRLAQRCREAGCRVHAVHLWHEAHRLFSPYQRRAQEGLDLFDRGIEAAVRLGAPVLVWHGAERRAIAGDEDWRRFVDVVLERGAACAAAGRRLTIENVSWCALASVRDVAVFNNALDEANPSRTIGFTFDPFQAAEAGANPFMLLAAMRDCVANVHLSDYQEGSPEARHLPPGDGDLPWPAILRAIRAAYRGPLMIEGVIGTDYQRLDRCRDTLEPMLADLRDADDPCAGAPPPGVLEGIRLFNEREFYACHEVIEHEWHAERRTIRRLYQGILQIGVGFHHALSGNHRGALLLLRDGIDKTTEFLPFCLGIETDLLVTQSRACLDRLTDLGPNRLNEWDPDDIPVIMPFGAGRDGKPRDPLPEPIPISRYLR
jgi:sugar phosphate isomerase/epimerase